MAGYQGWWQSLNNFLQYFKAPKSTPAVGRNQTVYHVPPPSSPREEGEVMTIITEAARKGVLIWMQYNGNKRYVEPYSWRFRGGHQLFYGYCHKDQSIESFRPDRIQDIEMTDIPYKPRWPVEIGRG